MGDCIHQTEFILKVINDQVLLYLYCWKISHTPLLWCLISLAPSTSFYLASASAPQNSLLIPFKDPIVFLLKRIVSLPLSLVVHNNLLNLLLHQSICFLLSHLCRASRFKSLPLLNLFCFILEVCPFQLFLAPCF